MSLVSLERSSSGVGCLAALLLAGCSSTPECRLASDCASPLLCVSGRCVPECREDRDCRDALRCVNSSCVASEEPPRLCASTANCRASETCQGGLCQAIVLVVGGQDAGLARRDASAPGADASEPVDGPRFFDATAMSMDAAAPRGLPYGAVCARAGECASMLCLGPSGAPQGRCSRTCATSTDCAFPDTCVDVPGAGFLCGPMTGQPAGASCPNGPTDCSSGLCLSPPGVGPFCTQLCAPLPTCPSGLTCVPVADGIGGALTVCGVGTGLGFGESCSAASQCDARLCLGVGAAAQGTCTARCDQGVPCPSGWTCAGVDDGAGGTIRICAPSGAVGGSFGSACTGASGCQSGLCLSDARTGAAFCTITCASNSDCRGRAGSTCVTLADGSQVCGP